MSIPRLTRGGAALIAVALALLFAARTTGAGWLMVLFCGLTATVGLSVLWPFVAVARVRLEALSGPTDAVAGDGATITIRGRRAGLGVRIRARNPDGPNNAITGRAPVALELPTPQRGVIDSVTVEVASGAPFGFVWARRRLTVPLTRSIEVAPRRMTVSRTLPHTGAPDGDARQASGGGGDLVRGIREYRPGDAMRLVHWPATARHGAVVVKELEHPEQARIEVVVDLRGADAERVAEHAMGLVCAAIDQGVWVVLHTREAGGPRTARTASALDAGRRLARAVPGVPGAPDGGVQAIRVGASA